MSLWFIQLIPDAWLAWAVNLTLIVGAVSFVLGIFTNILPFLRSYSPMLKVVGFILLLVGAYFKGGYGVEMEYRARIAEMKARIEVMEQKSAEENARLTEEIQTETRIVQEDTAETLAELERLREQINANCELTPDMIELYNKGMSGGNE